MTTLWYSIRMSGKPDINNGGTYFDGYFSVVPTSATRGKVNHFYDSTNCNTDIYVDATYDGADNIFLIDIQEFSGSGTLISAIPAFTDTIYSRNCYSLYGPATIFVGFNLPNETDYISIYNTITVINKISEPPYCPPPPIYLTTAATGPASIPTKQNIPNNQSKAVMGMPFKPAAMTQGSFFAISRAAYNRNVNQNVDSIGKEPSPPGKKKWIGASASRTSAEHIRLKSIEATGKGTTNRLMPQTFSFSGPDQTTTKTALARCRGNGCVAPKKKET